MPETKEETIKRLTDINYLKKLDIGLLKAAQEEGKHDDFIKENCPGSYPELTNHCDDCTLDCPNNLNSEK